MLDVLIGTMGRANDAKHPNISKTPSFDHTLPPSFAWGAALGSGDTSSRCNPLPCTITLVSEAMQDGALSDWLPPPPPESTESSVSATANPAACSLTELQRIQIAVDVAKGLSHLHSTCKLLHGDVCAANIGIAELGAASGSIRAQLVFPSFTITMREFFAGSSASGDADAAAAAPAGGSASAHSGGRKPLPAAVVPNKAGVQADLRAFGIVLLQLFMGTAATADDPTAALFNKARMRVTSPAPSLCSATRRSWPSPWPPASSGTLRSPARGAQARCGRTRWRASSSAAEAALAGVRATAASPGGAGVPGAPAIIRCSPGKFNTMTRTGELPGGMMMLSAGGGLVPHASAGGGAGSTGRSAACATSSGAPPEVLHASLDRTASGGAAARGAGVSVAEVLGAAGGAVSASGAGVSALSASGCRACVRRYQCRRTGGSHSDSACWCAGACWLPDATLGFLSDEDRAALRQALQGCCSGIASARWADCAAAAAGALAAVEAQLKEKTRRGHDDAARLAAAAADNEKLQLQVASLREQVRAAEAVVGRERKSAATVRTAAATSEAARERDVAAANARAIALERELAAARKEAAAADARAAAQRDVAQLRKALADAQQAAAASASSAPAASLSATPSSARAPATGGSGSAASAGASAASSSSSGGHVERYRCAICWEHDVTLWSSSAATRLASIAAATSLPATCACSPPVRG